MEQQPSEPPIQNNHGANTQQGLSTAPQSQPVDALEVKEESPEVSPTLLQSPLPDAAKVEMPSPKYTAPVPLSHAETEKIEVASPKDPPMVPQSQPAAAAKAEVDSSKTARMVPQSTPADTPKADIAFSKDASTVPQSPPADTAKVEETPSKDALVVPQSLPADVAKVDSAKASPTVLQFSVTDNANIEEPYTKASPTLPQFPLSSTTNVDMAIPEGAPMVPQPPSEDAAKTEMTSPKTAPKAPQSPPVAAAKVEVKPPKDSLSVRHCHLVRRTDFEGYGFLFGEDNERKQQLVTAVEPGSPAEAAGLRVKDIIIQVNGVEIDGACHQDIINRLNSIPSEAHLLVVNEVAFDSYKKHVGVNSLPSAHEMSDVAGAETIQSDTKPAIPQARFITVSSPPTVVPLSVEHDSFQTSVRHTSPNSSTAIGPVATSGMLDPLVNVKQEPTSPTESTLRRRFTPDEGHQPSSQDNSPQVSYIVYYI
nr:phosphatase and actin regulator 4A-like [Rhipicephalus microplus]